MTAKKNYEPNLVVDTNKLTGDVSGIFAELVTLPDNIQFQRIMVYNGFDKSITIKFSDGSSSHTEVQIETLGKIVMDKFYHHGLIEWKYTVDAPTPDTGFFKMMNWPSE
jgi:hypothetical protein